MTLYDYEVARIAKEADPWDVPCPTCGEPQYVECRDQYNRDHALDGHPLRWAVAGALILDEVR